MIHLRALRSKTYRYADGNGNHYLIGDSRERSFIYQPIKPENSSSGVYDGGEPGSFRLTAAEHDQFRAYATRALNRRVDHVESRVMGSGMLTVRYGDREQTYILKPGAAAKEHLENLLDNIRQLKNKK